MSSYMCGDPPAPRSDFLAVLSGRHAVLYVGGGVLADGSYANDLWTYDVETAAWTVYSPPESTYIGRVLGSTYSVADDALWLVDEIETSDGGRGHRHDTTMRLVRLSRDARELKVVASLPHATHRDRYALAAGANGDLFLASSREHGDHTVVWLSPRGDSVRAMGIVQSDGVLGLGQARASEWGLTVGTTTGRDQPRMRGYRWSDFRHVEEHEWRARCL